MDFSLFPSLCGPGGEDRAVISRSAINNGKKLHYFTLVILTSLSYMYTIVLTHKRCFSHIFINYIQYTMLYIFMELIIDLQLLFIIPVICQLLMCCY